MASNDSQATAGQLTSLNKHFREMFLTGEFSDITLLVDGKEIRAHKIILAQSPVFKAMFQHDMNESLVGLVTIADADYHVMFELVHFMYTGEVLVVGESSYGGLLAAADKYDMPALKQLCAGRACEKLNEENALEFLRLADLHGAERLRRMAAEFVVERARSFCRKDEFKALDGSLKGELFAMLAEREDRSGGPRRHSLVDESSGEIGLVELDDSDLDVYDVRLSI